MHIKRHISQHIREALSDTPVVMLTGPRQAGKTTLARQLTDDGYEYLTLDDELLLLAAKEDPVGFIRGHDRMVIDEVQRAPQLLLAIKKSVDEDRRPGRFLLTGSANVMTLPKVADSLAGRMETLRLLPLSQSEIVGSHTNWLDAIFRLEIPKAYLLPDRESLPDIVCRGGFPEAVSRTTTSRRQAWASQYIDAIIQRDVQDIGGIEKLDQLPRLLKVLGHTAGQMCNYSRLAGEIGLDGKTAAKYVGVFEQIFLLIRIPPWSRNNLSKLVKTPKLQFIDTGLLSALLNLTPANLANDRQRYGYLLENFVASEILKHNTFAETRYDIMHYRDRNQNEVDLLIEDRLGNIAAIEVKAAATVRSNDLTGLKKLKDQLGSQFKIGIVMYDGDQLVSLGDRLWAVPVASLWG